MTWDETATANKDILVSRIGSETWKALPSASRNIANNAINDHAQGNEANAERLINQLGDSPLAAALRHILDIEEDIVIEG